MAMDFSRMALPLCVYAQAVQLQSGQVNSLHYGLFESPDEDLAGAQQRATDRLFRELPPPPARLLEVGIGLGTTLRRLLATGYRITGVTPDAWQIANAADCARLGATLIQDYFQTMPWDGSPFDIVLFQESAQYVDTRLLMTRCAELLPPGGTLLIMDEVMSDCVEPALAFAREAGLRLEQRQDLTAQAGHTPAYLAELVDRHADPIRAALGDAALLEGLLDGLKGRLALGDPAGPEIRGEPLPAPLVEGILAYAASRGVDPGVRAEEVLTSVAASRPLVDFLESERPRFGRELTLSREIVRSVARFLRRRAELYRNGSCRYLLLRFRRS